MTAPSAPSDILVTAGLLVIGDEILSGRTKDKNIGYIAEYLTAIGVDLREVRVVPDVEDEIVAALNALRHKYTYVFTTGGIGPTHDDITSECVAKAFDIPLRRNERAVDLLTRHYGGTEHLTDARLRMAHVPEGAQLMALFAAIKSLKVRRRVVELVKALAEEAGDGKRS